MTTDKKGDRVAVTRNGNQYEINYPETGERAGLTQFLDHEGERIFYHTEIDEDFGGRGLASLLVREALTTTTGEGLGIVPVCPFVKGFLEKNGHDGEHRTPRPADLSFLRQQLGEQQ